MSDQFENTSFPQPEDQPDELTLSQPIEEIVYTPVDMLIPDKQARIKAFWDSRVLELADLQLEGVINPAKIAQADPKTLGVWHYGHVMNRFSTDSRTVKGHHNKNLFGRYNRDDSPDFGMHLHQLAENIEDESADKLATIIEQLALTDEERSLLRNQVAHQGANIKALLAANSPEYDTGVFKRYAESYDRLQTAYISKNLADWSGIEIPVAKPRSSPLEVSPMQLAWEVLPEGSSLVQSARKDLIKDDQQLTKTEIREKFDFRRLEILQEIVDFIGNDKVNIFRARPTTVGYEPYYVAEITIATDQGSHKVAVAESPLYANATYIVNEAYGQGSWEEILQLSKREARERGAHKVVHAAKPEDFDYEQHRKRIWDYLTHSFRSPSPTQ